MHTPQSQHAELVEELRDGEVVGNNLVSVILVTYLFNGCRSRSRSTGAQRVYLELGRAGAQSAKGLVLHGTAPWLEALARKVQRQPMVAEPQPLAARRGRWVTGNRDALQDSVQYPPTLCATVAGAHADYLAHRPGTGQFFRQLGGIVDSIGPIVVDDED